MTRSGKTSSRRTKRFRLRPCSRARAARRLGARRRAPSQRGEHPHPWGQRQRLRIVGHAWTRLFGCARAGSYSGGDSALLRFKARIASPTGGRGSEAELEVRGRSLDAGDEEGRAGPAGEVADERDVKPIAAPEEVEPKVQVALLDRAFLCPAG